MIDKTVTVMRIAIGEEQEDMDQEEGKNKAAVELRRKGGAARAKTLTKERRLKITLKAAEKRWRK